MSERVFNYNTLPENEPTSNRPYAYNKQVNTQAFQQCPYCRQRVQTAFAQENDYPATYGAHQAGAEQRMIQQFLNDDGQVDIQKMLQTIGQFADTVQQVSPVIKQINDLVKSFRT